MMFQSYALWPHMSVAANVAYPLENRGVGRAERAARVAEALALVGIPELARQYPGEMSGGQQQRVALARALVANDRLILFDEPLSNVDAKVRERLRVELQAMQRRLGFAAVYVTHDQTEAMELATRIAVMRDGRVVQVGTSREIYERPASRYVANFVGVANEMPGVLDQVEGTTATLKTAGGPVMGVAGAGLRAGAPAVAVWRPEHGRLHAEPPAGVNAWPALRSVELFAGPHFEHHVIAGELTLRVWGPADEAGAPGQAAWVQVDPARVLILPADLMSPAPESVQ
jgi:iron(III) transport system ATP-binding protein